MRNIAGCVIVAQRDSISKFSRVGTEVGADSASTAIVHGYGIAVSASPLVSDRPCSGICLVGSGNHRQFLLFVGALVVGISLFDALAVSCEFPRSLYLAIPFTQYIDYTQNAPTFEPTPSAYLEPCNVFPSLCGASRYAPFLLVVALWSTLQLTWTIILLLTQVFQVCRQMTTLEVSNLGRYGFMGGRGGSSLREQTGAIAQLMARQGQAPAQQASVLGAGPGQSGAEEVGEVLSSTEAGDAVGSGAFVVGGINEPHAHGPGCKHGSGGHAHGHHHRCGIVGRICSTALHACTGGPMLQLLGLDRFTKGKAMTGMRKAGQGGAGSNPFNMGIVGVGLLVRIWTRVSSWLAELP